MITRRELIQKFVLFGGTAIGSGAFGSLLDRSVFAKVSAASGPIVTTNLGKLRGAHVNGVYSFKGIHYGASTAGPLRFQPPVPPNPWTGVRDALQVGPPAPQVLDYGGFWRGLSGPGDLSEDCLVLNVWTPDLRGRGKRPVMVWLHGGNFGVGSGGAALYDGANLAAKHDVVVLTINHRLNLFGYLYLRKLCGNRFADSGNAGMLDIVLALQWIRDNIAQFGGDPANVTLFGQSGGGYKIGTLMAMPSARQLFHKAIIQSGSVLRVDSAQDADALASKCLAQLRVSPDRIDDLASLSAEEIIAALQKMKPEPFFAFSPVVDDHSLPRQPFDPDAPAETAGVPMLIGTNSLETTSLNGDFDPTSFSLDATAMRSRLKGLLHLDDQSRLDALIATYEAARPGSTPSDIYFAVTTDVDFRMDAIAQAERKVAQRTAPAYMYRFDWPLPMDGGRFKAAHGAEIPFVFDNLDKAPNWGITRNERLQRLADKVSGAWAAFARTGNSNHAGLPHWPAYDPGSRATMILNDECHVENDPGKAERTALSSLRQS
jgi:para-nitrobenzyl esterase